jgi:4-hydroxy-2-oxoheptanedioate aldolase
LNSANENISVLVQIETREGVENVEQIAAVDGVGEYFWSTRRLIIIPPLSADVLFIGPYDLSISLGYAPPSPDPHPDVEKVIQKILQATHNAGKKWSVL